MLARYVASRRSFRGEFGIEPAETAGDADACVCDSAGGGGTCCCSSGEPDRLMPCGGCAGCCWGDWRGDAPDDAGADWLACASPGPLRRAPISVTPPLRYCCCASDERAAISGESDGCE